MYPYNFQPYQQPYQQPQMQAAGLPGRVVSDFSEITIRDIPTDGSCAYFIKADGSEIQGRRWSENGSVIPVMYTRADSTIQVDPMQQRLAAIEARLDRIEKGGGNE